MYNNTFNLVLKQENKISNKIAQVIIRVQNNSKNFEKKIK